MPLALEYKFGHQMAPLALVTNLATRWRHLHLEYKFGHQMAPLALVPNLATRWRISCISYKFAHQVESLASPHCLGLTLSVSIEFVSSSAIVTSVQQCVFRDRDPDPKMRQNMANLRFGCDFPVSCARLLFRETGIKLCRFSCRWGYTQPTSQVMRQSGFQIFVRNVYKRWNQPKLQMLSIKS